MITIVYFLLGILIASGIGAFNFFRMKRIRDGDTRLKDEQNRLTLALNDLLERFDLVHTNLMKVEEAAPLARELRNLEQELKNKSAKVSVSLSELEAVESRLQELEEIRREVEASASEIKEELRSLQERESELMMRRQELEQMLFTSAERMSTISTELAMSEEVQEQIERMQSELVSTQEQCEKLLNQIQQGNEQSMAMKQRYNALDIEYALLYERFARLESAG